MGRFLVAVVLMASTAAPANADKEKAKAAYKAGATAYDLLQYDRALEFFKQAYTEENDAMLLYNIAQCHRQLGDKQKAVGFYMSYLRRLPDAPNAPEVKQRIASLQSEIALEKTNKSGPPAGTMPPSEETTRPSPTREPPPAPHEPASTTEPAQSESAMVAVNQPELKSQRKPVYKRWYLWVPIVVVVAAGVGLGLGLGLSHGPHTPTAPTTDGTYSPF